MVQTKALSRTGESQMLDEIVMGTNSSSIVSKRSVERLYFADEPHFFRYFVPKFQRRSPLINRGYWLRLRAIDTVLRRFIAHPQTKKRVVVNLGCGSDVIPWQCHTRYPSACRGLLFVDIDFPDLILRKRNVVLQMRQLRELLGDEFQVNDADHDRVLLRSEQYCQVGCDLRNLDELRRTLDTLLPLSGCDILFVAEVSITYMETRYADDLIQWASSLGHAEFCLLEHLVPQGPEQPFAATMLSHLHKLNAPPRSVGQYPTSESQRDRFQNMGWQSVKVWDLWDVWSSDDFLSGADRASLDEVEPFDEWEEFMLFARHYVLVHASTLPGYDGGEPEPHPTPQSTGKAPEISIDVECHQKSTPKRRFGEAIKVSNSIGNRFAIHLMGLGISGRAESCDVYSLGRHDDLPKLPLTGPLPRMCSTTTDLGEYGLLLAGGRGSPASPLSDCWLFRKEPECCWHLTWSLPVPLFRHSAVRLRGSSLALLVGGKTNNSRISEDCFVFDPEKGWCRCRVKGAGPRPTIGAILCNTRRSGNTFHGLLTGGITQDGRVATEKHSWSLQPVDRQWTIEFRPVDAALFCQVGDPLSRFGAKCVELGPSTVVCGGTGQDSWIQGRDIVLVETGDDGSYTVFSLRCQDGAPCVPFMIGSCVVANGDSLVMMGGGATCFSMGTFWETGLYTITARDGLWHGTSVSASRGDAGVEYVESRKAVTCANRDNRASEQPPAAKAVVARVPRVRLGPQMGFGEIIDNGKPVVIEGLGLGDCVQKWTSDYLIQQIGKDTEVVVHECHRDTEKMDFNSKNFSYVRDSFEAVMTRMRAGERLYLRSLSHEKPSQQPAKLEEDFPGLAADFRLPPELDRVSRNLFSSVLRVSGKVNMWLHYDVMANIYAQVAGRKRMMLFPPSDVGHFSFAPGASSSSVDVFASLDGPCLAATRPHEAVLEPGDLLFLPPLWLHTSEPVSSFGVAVNVFFRDLESGYAAGRDVYGNRDLAAYEKGRQDAMRVVRGFQRLPLETRRFYLGRIADELRQAAEQD